MSAESRAARRAALEAELAQIEQAERNEKQALRDKIVPVYKFTVTPAPESSRFHEVWDDTVVLYWIEGEVTNREELEAVGKGHTMGGKMMYAYNTVTHKIITTVSGGTTFRQVKTAIPAIGRFLEFNPEGGDVTSLVLSFDKES